MGAEGAEQGDHEFSDCQLHHHHHLLECGQVQDQEDTVSQQQRQVQEPYQEYQFCDHHGDCQLRFPTALVLSRRQRASPGLPQVPLWPLHVPALDCLSTKQLGGQAPSL